MFSRRIASALCLSQSEATGSEDAPINQPMNPETEGRLFYYSNDSETVEGPHPWEQLLELHGNGVISPATAICEAGSDEWTTLGQLLPSDDPGYADPLAVVGEAPAPSVDPELPPDAVRPRASGMTPYRWAAVAGAVAVVAILAYTGIRFMARPAEKPPEVKPAVMEVPKPPSIPAATPAADIRRLHADAERGNPWAQYQLGIKYRDGAGVAKNQAQALQYLQQSAEAGNVWGQVSLAGMHARGELRDEAKHFYWIEKAAENGDQLAMIVAALCHADGLGTPKNPEKATRWSTEATKKDPEKAAKAAAGADWWVSELRKRDEPSSSASDLLGTAGKNRVEDAPQKQANPEAMTAVAEMPSPPPAKPVPTPAASPPPAGKAQASKQDGGQQPDSGDTPDFLPPTAPLAEPGSSAPKQKVLVTEVYGPSPGAASFRLHYMLAQKLKEKGHEITVVGNPQTERRIIVGGGPIQNLGTFSDIVGMTPDKWIAEDKVNIADYGVVLAAGHRPVPLVYKAQFLGKLIVIGQDEGPWVFERDKKAANSAEKEYLKAQADKGYLKQSSINKFWRNAPWWDEEAAKNTIKNGHSMAGLSKVVVTAKDGVTSITANSTFGAMRPCDVAAWKNAISYNVNPGEDRRGYDGMSGYSSAALDKFASEILCPAVERAIQTHKEIPEVTSVPKVAKASHLPPRPSLPKSFPLERPKREGKVVCSEKGDPATTVGALLEGQAKARAVPGNLRAVQIACSYLPTTCLALKPDGTVVAWGNDESICNVPAGLTDVVQVALGDGWPGDLAAALKADGTVVVWGKGAEELQCDLSGIVQIVVGNGQVTGLKADGTITAVQPKAPQRHRSDLATIKEPLVQISGGRNPLGLTGEGKIVALGSRPDSDFYIPSELGEVASLADCHNSQAQQSAVILIDGTVASWGRNDVGQASVPDGLSDVVQLSTGNDTTFAVKRDGALVGWGSNWFGQLQIPQPIKKAIQVAAGSDVTLAIVED